MKNRRFDGINTALSHFLVIVAFFFFQAQALYAEDQKTSASPVLKAAPAAVISPSDDVTKGDNAEVNPGTSNITLDFKDADINTVLRVLSLKSKVNIVAGPEVQGTVTIRLENVPWEKALEVVLRTYDYVYERDGNIVRVTTREKMAQESVVTQTYILNYTRAQEVQDSVREMLTERGRIRIAERTNTLIITDIPTNLYRVQEVIKKLDQRTPQAYIDSKIVRTEAGVADNLGITWAPGFSLSGSKRPTTFPYSVGVNDGDENISPVISQFFAGVTTAAENVANPSDLRSFPFQGGDSITENHYEYGTLDFSTFTATLNWLRSQTNTKIVSNPRIVVLNNQAAQVQVGSEIPLPQFERNETTGSVEISGFEYRDVGVILNVTPHINSEEEILVELAPEVSSLGETIEFGDFNIPSFDVTQAKSQVLIRSGETIAIGGLMTDASTVTKGSLPGLADIPLIGRLFKNKSQEAGTANQQIETLFFITVTMVDTEGQPVGERIGQRRNKKFGTKNEDKKAEKLVATPSDEAKILAGTKNVNPEVPAQKVNSLEPNKVAAPAQATVSTR